jgi:general L-amino acid transport system substrate-binding protein
VAEIKVAAVAGLLVALASIGPAAADTLAAVRAAGHLSCGVVTEPDDWNKVDMHGPLAPLDAATCDAVAVSALGPAARTDIHRYAAEQDAEAALQKGDVALIVGVTPGVTPLMRYGIWFGPPVYYDAQGFLVRRDAGIATLQDLAGKGVCYEEGTDTERTLQARTLASGIALIPMPFQEQGEMNDALLGGHCEAISADISKLAATRASFHRPDDFVMLSDTLTLQPVTPAYRYGDQRWGAIVDWTVHALVLAESLGLTSTTIADAAGDDPVLQRLTGADFATASALGLPHDWTTQLIKSVGNYGEIYARTIGEHGALHLPRGLNALWTRGGLMRPLPVQ